MPAQDSSTLQTVDISANTNKQFWITVYVPADAVAGSYTSDITLSSSEISKTLQLNLTVLPITLDASSLTHALFYYGRLRTDGYGTISHDWKNPTQFAAEMTDMHNHGITNIFMAAPQYSNAPLDYYLGDALTAMNAAGMTEDIFYSGGGYDIESKGNDLDALKVLVTGTMTTSSIYGKNHLYVYGPDEEDMDNAANRAQIEAVHSAGAYVFVSQSLMYSSGVADILDLAVVFGKLRPELAGDYHDYGHKIFSYANPQIAEENPENYRRNYGMMLWQAGYDGAMAWAYQVSRGNIWDDFDYAGRRDSAMSYPTIDGIIPTIAWEGWREGVDDMRYLTTLDNLITQVKASGEKSTQSAENWVTNLRKKRLVDENLDDIRTEMIAHILYLLGQGTEPTYVASCGNGIKENDEVCDSSDVSTLVCADYNYTGGVLGCSSDCARVDTSACAPTRLNFSAASSTEFNLSYINRSWTNITLNIDASYDSSVYITFGAEEPVAYWNFDEGSGTMINDIMSDNDGIIDYGDYGTADSGTTESVIKETTYPNLRNLADYYNGWIFEATSGTADGSTTTVSDFAATSEIDKEITLTSALSGFATGDTFRMYKNTTQAVWSTGKFGNALYFDGIDDFLHLNGPSSTDITGDKITTEAWVNPTTFESSYNQAIIVKQPQYYFGLLSEDANLIADNDFNSELRTIICTNNTTWTTLDGVTSVPTSTWTHLATVYDGTSIKLYVNGVLDATTSTPYTTGNLCDYYNGYTQIGRYTTGNAYSANPYEYFAGLIDEVKIWKRALTQNEIRASYNASLYSNSSMLFTGLSAGTATYTIHIKDANGTSSSTARTVYVSPTVSTETIDLNARGFNGTISVLPTSNWDWMRVSSSTLTINASTTKTIVLGTTATNTISFTPTGGDLTVAFEDTNIANGYLSQFTASSTVSSTSVSFSLETPTSGLWYEVDVGENHLNTYQSDSSGIITFTYNSGFSTKTFTVGEDTTPPSSFELSSPDDYSVAGNNQPTFSWGAPSDPDIDHYEIYVDNILKNDNVSDISQTVSPKIDCGNHTWYVKAVDKAGNKTQSTSTRTIAITCGGGGIIPPSSFSGSGNITQDLGGEVKKIFQTGAMGVIKFLPQSIIGTAVLEIIALDPMEIIKKYPIPSTLNILGDVVVEIKALAGGKEIKKINSEAKLSFIYGEEQIKNSEIKKDTMKIYRYDETKKIWISLKSNSGTLTNEISLKTDIFGIFGVFGQSSATSTTSTLATSTLEQEIKITFSTTSTSSTVQVASSSLKINLGIPDNFSFERFLWRGAVGQDVKYLQILLKSMGKDVYPEGIVSGYFGNLTKKAIIRLQEMYAEEILKPLKLKKGTGIFHVKTKAWANEKIDSAY